MRDFSNLEGATPSYQDRSKDKDWDDSQGMTEQGFKRFRRKKQRNADASAVSRRADPSGRKAKTPVTGSSIVLHSSARETLPATLPETWDRLRRVMPGMHKNIMEGAPLVSFHRDDPAAKAFDLLRTRILNTLRAKGWKRIAVAAPTQGCGATFTAVNLALSLARVPNSRNILLDLNHRDPGVAKALDLAGFGDMPGFLAGRVSLERQLIRTGETLALGLASNPDRDAAEILHDSQCAMTLDHMCEELDPDVVIFDLPPVLEYDDLIAILPEVDAVLLVTDGTQTSPQHLEACEKVLNNQTQLLGVVLNRARQYDA
jgi:protein-tyrosine kinase